MDDIQPKTSAAPVTSKPGFSAPIEMPASGNVPEHIHPDTLMAKGIDPDTKQRVSVNLKTLQVEFGEKKGREMYGKIARAGGFYDPNVEPSGSEFYPDLQLEGLNKDARANVDAILNTKE
jgi:hypothetical protein